MPPKRQSPLESDPPSASSSDEETEEEGSESEDEEQPPKSSTPKPPSGSGSCDEESEEDTEEEEPKNNPSADSESESESDIECVKHMIAPSNAPVTHIASAAGKRKKVQVKSNGAASPLKKVAKIMKSAKVEPVEEEEEDGAGGLEYPYLSRSMQNNPMLPVPPEGLVGLVANKGWDLMGANIAEALDKKWKSVLIAETKAYLQWISVVLEQTKLMLDVLESSDR